MGCITNTPPLISGLELFHRNSSLVQFMFYLVYLNLQIALAFFAATWFSNAKTATGSSSLPCLNQLPSLKVGATILLSHEADAIGMKNLADKFSAMADLEFMYHHGVVIW